MTKAVSLSFAKAQKAISDVPAEANASIAAAWRTGTGGSVQIATDVEPCSKEVYQGDKSQPNEGLKVLVVKRLLCDNRKTSGQLNAEPRSCLVGRRGVGELTS